MLGIFYIRMLENVGKILRDNLANPSTKKLLLNNE